VRLNDGVFVRSTGFRDYVVTAARKVRPYKFILQ
jgi:hypothetical protein